MPDEILIYEGPNAASPVQGTLAGKTVWLT
jgi:hypothetical protein